MNYMGLSFDTCYIKDNTQKCWQAIIIIYDLLNVYDCIFEIGPIFKNKIFNKQVVNPYQLFKLLLKHFEKKFSNAHLLKNNVPVISLHIFPRWILKAS